MAKKKVTKKTAIIKNPKKQKNKTPLLIISIVLIVIGAFLLAQKQSLHRPQTIQQTTYQLQPINFDFRNQTIFLNNQRLLFTNGEYKDTNSQHTATITDRNIDTVGTQAAAILIDNPEASGTFYYLIAAMQKNNQEIYATPILLGDRIKIQSINVDNPQSDDNGIITVEYLDRPADAPMSEEPTIAVTKKYAFEDNGNLIEILH